MYILAQLIFIHLKTYLYILRENEIKKLKEEIIEQRKEIILLRQQITVFLPKKKRMNHLSNITKLFWVFATKFCDNWKDALIIVKPDTVINWTNQYKKYRWRKICKNKGGRPKIDYETIYLIKKMAKENPRWGAPRIHGELIHLGINVSEATVSRYMPRRTSVSQQQSWNTFIKNHICETIGVDFFVMPTIQFKFLYGFIAIHHGSREIVHINVTYHPSQIWVLRQLRDLMFDREYKYLIRDNDRIFGNNFKGLIENLGLEDKPTTFKSPWQNGYCERAIGSIRRELLDHIIIINERQARSLLTDYQKYYNESRPHLGLQKTTPFKRDIETSGEIQEEKVCAGLHTVYRRYESQQNLSEDRLAA